MKLQDKNKGTIAESGFLFVIWKFGFVCQKKNLSMMRLPKKKTNLEVEQRRNRDLS